MKNLRKLSMAIALTFVTGMSVFADCSTAPGEVHSPPCAAAQITPDDSKTPEQVTAPVSGGESDFQVSDAMIDILQTVLSLL